MYICMCMYIHMSFKRFSRLEAYYLPVATPPVETKDMNDTEREILVEKYADGVRDAMVNQHVCVQGSYRYICTGIYVLGCGAESCFV